jgi:hypothetical protein
MEHFLDSLLTEQRRISCILGVNYDVLPLTRAEKLWYFTPQFSSSSSSSQSLHCRIHFSIV